MIQRSTPTENLGTITYSLSRLGSTNVKFSVKEKKAAKRKEKSRVAAQIRRNKESQTLILLQNALPLGLPTPSQMLEKSIVIRIAGQTLFLMNTLDQVLGMKGWLTIPLMSNNFLTFFMDVTGYIAYVTPNIQFLMEQYHWSNLIGMSIYDIVDFKSAWPTTGEVVYLRLPTNPTLSPCAELFPLRSQSPSQPGFSRAPIPSRLNIRKNSQSLDSKDATSSLYHVWCHTSISHTNTRLKLLVLQAVRIKATILNCDIEISRPPLLCKGFPMPLQRSISCPSMSVPIGRDQHKPLNPFPITNTDEELSLNLSQHIYQRLITSAQDRYLYFKSASNEFCQLIGETSKSLLSRNFLDIIHLEDVLEIKSFLDQVIEDNEIHSWTPVYKIMCQNGCYCVLKTLCRHYCTASSDLIILRHLVIEGPQLCQQISKCSVERKGSVTDFEDTIISRAPTKDSVRRKPSNESLYIPRLDHDNTILKRKCDDIKRTIVQDKYVRFLDRTFSMPGAERCGVDFDTNQFLISSSDANQHMTRHDRKITNEMLFNDPFLPVGLENGASAVIRKSFSSSDRHSISRGSTSAVFKHDRKSQYLSRRSPSYSLESCVLTSPGSESTDIPIDDHFIWQCGDNFHDISQLNEWLDEQFQTELDLNLPI